MDGQTNDSQNQPHWEIFPRWFRVCWIILGLSLVTGLVVLIIKSGRGAVPALAVAAGAAVAGIATAKSIPTRRRLPIDKGFVRSRVQALTHHLLKTKRKTLFTPTELCRFLNIMLEKAGLTRFGSPHEMAQLLGTMGLKSQVRTVTGRSERRWYDLIGNGTHESPTS